MNEADLYNNVVVSITRVIEQFRLAEMPNSQYINWDAHAQINELPARDVIGLAGVGMAEDEPKNYSIVCGIAIATYEDPHLSRLTKLISKLRAKFANQARITVYDHGAAVPDSFMVAALPLAIMPVGNTESRSMQAIEVHLILDPGAASSLR
jgi:hypothetical protein